MRPRFAMYWAAGCGGCDIAVLNVGELLLRVGDAFDVVFWPAAMDRKVADVEAMPDESIDLTLFSGGIRSTENEAMARLLRAKSKTLVAFGSCAGEGCIPGLANLWSVDELLDASYAADRADTTDALRPLASWTPPDGAASGDGEDGHAGHAGGRAAQAGGHAAQGGGVSLRLPTLLPLLRTLDQTVPVDYVVPGCPPESNRIAEILEAVLASLDGGPALPPRGTVLGAAASTVCEACHRARDVKRISAFHRIQELPSIDPEICLLEQGVACSGPATRNGCGALCPAAGVPCFGCYGPADGVVDGGARLLSAFASVVEAQEPDDIERILDGIPDPVGQAYRFTLAASLLQGSRRANGNGHAASGGPDR